MNGENNDRSPVTQPGWQFRPDESTSTVQQSPADEQTAAGNENKVVTPQQPSPQPAAQPASEQGQAPFTAQAPAPPTDNTPKPEATWSASEFIAHEKNAGWYVLLVVASVVIIGLVYLITHDLFSLIAVALALIAFGIAAKRKPKSVEYHIGPEGLSANGRLYAYSNFKSFGLQDEGAFSSLVFMPMKRFMLPLYVYFPPEDRDDIMEVISHYLPFSPVQQGMIDRTTHRLRF